MYLKLKSLSLESKPLVHTIFNTSTQSSSSSSISLSTSFPTNYEIEFKSKKKKEYLEQFQQLKQNISNKNTSSSTSYSSTKLLFHHQLQNQNENNQKFHLHESLSSLIYPFKSFSMGIMENKETQMEEFVPIKCSSYLRFSVSEILSDLPTAVNNLFQKITKKLSYHNMDIKRNINFINLYVPDLLSSFSSINSLYVSHFSHNPPSRACLQGYTPSIKNETTEIQIECICSSEEEEENFKKECLHVQSLSFWAPACIGPYSQATILKSKTETFDGVMYLAGQIGLEPYSLQLINDSLISQTYQMMNNCLSVLNCLHSSFNNSLIVSLFISTSAFSNELQSSSSSMNGPWHLSEVYSTVVPIVGSFFEPTMISNILFQVFFVGELPKESSSEIVLLVSTHDRQLSDPWKIQSFEGSLNGDLNIELEYLYLPKTRSFLSAHIYASTIDQSNVSIISLIILFMDFISNESWWSEKFVDSGLSVREDLVFFKIYYPSSIIDGGPEQRQMIEEYINHKMRTLLLFNSSCSVCLFRIQGFISISCLLSFELEFRKNNKK